MKGLGTDICDVARIEKSLKKDAFKNLVFTDAERAYCDSKTHPAQHYAARFAAKEAYMKAIGMGWTSDSDFREIEVVKDLNDAPSLILHGKTKMKATELKLNSLWLSMSHTRNYATAVVVID